MRADELDRLDDAPHRPLAQARIPVEDRSDRAARDRAHDEPAAGAGITEIQHRFRLPESAYAHPVHPPRAFARALDAGAEGAHGLRRVEDVFAFKQPFDARLADRHGAEDEGAMGDRLVAGHAHAAFERPGAARHKRRRSGLIHASPS